MTKLDRLIAELCPDGVEYATIGDIGDVCMCKRIFREQTGPSGDVPFFKIGTFGKEPDSFIPQDLFDEYRMKYSFPNVGDILISAAGTIGRTVTYNGELAYFQDSNIVWVNNDESKILNRFLFYFYSLQPWTVSTGGTISRLYNDSIRRTAIPLPPLPVQHEIVHILDNFTELTAELTARKKQYEYYRNELLSFGDDVPMVPLGEVAQYSKTRINAAKLDSNNYVGVDNILPNTSGKMVSSYAPEHGVFTRFDKDDVLIGNIRPYLKKIWLSDITGGTNGDVLVVHRTDNILLPRFLYQLLASDKFFAYDMQHAKGAKMPRGSKESVMQYRIPLPSLAEQARIVAILDQFDTLTTDLTGGLPAEIEARQQQYEYYRDKLLTFKEIA